MTSYPIIDVSSWEVIQHEPEGKDEKHWCRAPASGQEWVFKRVAPDRPGSHWAEKISGEVAAVMRLPAAKVELATCDRALGIISLDARPDSTWEQHGGAVLLEEVTPGWDSRSPKGYTLDRIRQVLGGIAAPPGYGELQDFNAFDVFSGYLVFDCLVANQDRHSRNWAVMRKSGVPPALMASYDHGSSLGYRLTDEYRLRRLIDEDELRRWCERGRAETFEDRPLLLDLANRALQMAGSQVAGFWRDRVADVTEAAIHAIVERTPMLSDTTSTFIARILSINRRRLLGA